MSNLDEGFTAVLHEARTRGGWTHVVMPGSAECFGTRGLVRIRGIDRHPVTWVRTWLSSIGTGLT